MKRTILIVVVLLLLFGNAFQVNAAVVTSIPGGTVEAMPAVNYFGTGPQTFGSGITVTWRSTNASNQGGSVFGYTGGYGFGTNGDWTGALGPMAGLNDSFAYWGVTDTMTFAFDTPRLAVGGFLNYLPDSGNPTTIAVYDTANTLIESYPLTFHTSGADNTGEFWGFQESTPIKYFTLTGNYVGLTRLTTAVPEPATIIVWSLLGGLAIAFGWRQRKAA